MNTLVIFGFLISLGLLEIVIFQIGAVILGFALSFFISSRKLMKSAQRAEKPSEHEITEADEWRLRFYEQKDLQKKWEEETQKEIDEKNYLEDVLTTKLNEVKAILQKKEQQENYLQQKLETLYKKIEQTGEQQESLSRELEQTKNELQLKSESESILQKKVEDNEAELASFRNMQQPDIQPGEYLSQLSTAQSNLLEHNQRISRLLEQIELLKESEKKHLDTLQVNEGLQSQLRDFRQALSDKESEIKQIRQQQILIHELKERLGKAHEEYNTLQEKLQKLEMHISKPHHRTFEYEELQQSYFKLTKECDEIKMKQLSMLEENQRLSRLLADTEDKLRESNFQRQQYQRKVTFLEELNRDLQELTGHHKKMENQMRRIGEIEMILNKNSDFRSQNSE